MFQLLWPVRFYTFWPFTALVGVVSNKTKPVGEGLAPLTKSELLKRLTKSLKKENSSPDKAFYGSFGAFCMQPL
jgi:hypothetical protein